jgi:hypothetical protein
VIVLGIAQVLLLPFAGIYGADAAILFTFSTMAHWRYRLLFNPASLEGNLAPHFELLA